MLYNNHYYKYTFLRKKYDREIKFKNKTTIGDL